MRTLPFLLFLATAGVSSQAPAEKATMRVFFGHQSVGSNVLDGVRAVAPELRVATRAAAGEPGIVIIDTRVGENTKPLSKLEDFERQVGQQARLLDAAMLKFCYVDIDTQTDVPKLFAAYVAAHERVRAAHPGLRLAYVTTPLTVVQSGPVIWLKQLMGSDPPGFVENQKRAQFNALLRGRYLGKEPVFDLAELEARSPTGETATFEVEGRAVPMLYAGYTDDGGHLNKAAQRTIGAAFAKFVASL